MASRWLRSVMYDYRAGSSLEPHWWRKAYSMWLYYIMEFSVQSQSASGGKSWTSTEKSGTGGSFSGTDLVLTDAAGTFAFTDQRKYIIIRDNTNPANGGIYPIRRYISSTQIEINYLAGYNEFPMSASGLSWWICGGTYQVPSTPGDQIRLQSRHYSGWAIELTNGDWAFYLLTTRVAPNGNWSDKIIGEFTGLGGPGGDSRYYNGLNITYGNGSGRQLFFAEADYDNCEWIHFWMHNDDTGGFVTSSAVNMFQIARVTPVEIGHTDDELIIIQGGQQVVHYFDVGCREYDGTYARGRSWLNSQNGEVTGYFADYTLGGYGNCFIRSEREPNWRRDGKVEAFYGMPYYLDENNYNGAYQLLGFVKGSWNIPELRTTSPSGDYGIHANPRHTHRMVPMNMGGNKNRLLLNDSMVIPWCGLSVHIAGY